MLARPAYSQRLRLSASAAGSQAARQPGGLNGTIVNGEFVEIESISSTPAASKVRATRVPPAIGKKGVGGGGEEQVVEVTKGFAAGAFQVVTPS